MSDQKTSKDHEQNFMDGIKDLLSDAAAGKTIKTSVKPHPAAQEGSTSPNLNDSNADWVDKIKRLNPGDPQL